MIKRLFFCLFLFISFEGFSQGGMHVYAGVAVDKNADVNVTPEGTAHYGYVIGADARLMGGGMYFLIGMQYADISLLAQDSPSFFSNEGSMKILKGRGGLGFTLYGDEQDFKVRAKVLGSLDYYYIYPAELIAGNGAYTKLNDATLGVLGGVGVEFKGITFDIEYEYNLINAYNKQPETKFNTLNFTAGFFF